MQRGNHILLNDMHNSPETLYESIEKVIHRALYKVSNNFPLMLRFITPVSHDEWLMNDNYNDYRLTAREEHEEGMMYVTLSYCSKHIQGSLDLPLMPRYHISNLSKSGEPRPISCWPLVFHRAMLLFARSHGCSRL